MAPNLDRARNLAHLIVRADAATTYAQVEAIVEEGRALRARAVPGLSRDEWHTLIDICTDRTLALKEELEG